MIIPINNRILIYKDADKTITRGGIILPPSVKIPTITGRVIELSPNIVDDYKFPISKHDKVLVNFSRAIPVELEEHNRLFVIPIDDVIAVFRSQ